LVPSWGDRHSRRLAGLAVAAALLAVCLRLPIRPDMLDDVTLRIVFPAMLAFVLAFAPRPSTRVGRIAGDLTVLGLCTSLFAGNYVPVLLALYPLLLVAALAIGASRVGTAVWGSDP
jgi:hypothetical protein